MINNPNMLEKTLENFNKIPAEVIKESIKEVTMNEEEIKSIEYWKEKLKDYKKEIIERQNDEFKGYGTLEDIAKLNYCTLHTVLKLIEKRKEEIETLKRDFEIVDHECSRLEQEDIRKDKIINLMAEYIDEITEEIAREKGVEDFEFCDNKCTDKDEYIECKQCIKEYFENKVKEE